MKRKAGAIEASSSMEKSPIEESFERFPQIGEEILKWLDNTTIAKCTLVSKTMHSFIGKQKVFWIRKINKYQYVGEDEMWKKFLHQTPQETVKKMSDAVYDFHFSNGPIVCNCSSKRKIWTPLQIAVGANCEFLCKFVLNKIAAPLCCQQRPFEGMQIYFG